MYSGITYFSTWKRSSLHKKEEEENVQIWVLQIWILGIICYWKKNDINVFKGLQIL